MYKILIADDEFFIRKGLSKIISKMGSFEVVGMAGNGEEAFELIRKNNPDIVISDVKMPKMNGIELISLLNKEYPKIIKIILSGFDEFNFVRETLKNGAYDYILKPVDSEKLELLLNEISEKIKKSKEEEKLQLALKKKSREGLSVLKDKIIRELVNGYYDEKFQIQKLVEYGFDYEMKKDMYSQVIVVQLDNFEIIVKELGIHETRLNLFMIRNIVEETIVNFSKYLSCYDVNGAIFVIPYLNNKVDELKGSLINNLDVFFKSKYTIGMGEKVCGLDNIRKSYLEAKRNLKYKFSSDEVFVTSGEIDRKKLLANKDMFYLIKKYYIRFINLIDLASGEQVNYIFDEIFLKVKEFKLNRIEILKLFNSIFVLIQTNLYHIDDWVGRIYGEDFSFNENLNMYNSLDDMKMFLVEFFENVIEKSKKYKKRRDTKLIEIVKNYIDVNYKENITLSKISAITYLNSNYFCEFFKEETNETFIDYLTNVRVNKAKELLKDVRIKVYEVSDMVGYNDSAYFCRVFKKIVGLTPSKYRERL